MEVKVLKKSEVVVQKLAKVTYSTTQKINFKTEENTKEAIQKKISDGIIKNCHDFIFIAENRGEIEGWLALYEITDSKMGHIWNWHPVVIPNAEEKTIANELIGAAFLHLNELGILKVTVDFRVYENNEPYLAKYLDWYSHIGISDIFEDKFYMKNLTDEDFEANIPAEYSLGHISETDIDDLYHCWLEIFSCCNDQFAGLPTDQR